MLVAPSSPNCKCRENMDPCKCGATITAYNRTIKGVYELCGFTEFANPSLPPKKYRLKTWSGHVHFGTCYSAEFGGADRWELPCHLIEDGTCNGGKIVQQFPACDAWISSYGEHYYVETKTKTVRTNTAVGVQYGCTPNYAEPAAGYKRETLSMEDTEAAAIARAVKAGTWSEWAEGGACCAWRPYRPAGTFSGSFQQAELKIVVKGGINEVVKVKVIFEQTPLAGGRSVKAEEQYELYCDGAGDVSEVITVPTAPGYSFCVIFVGAYD